MAYLLKYYKELVSHGHRWRLEIHQDTDDAIEAVEIGPVLQGLRLIMQGDQADIDTPIVKTSLEMVFVDAPDLEDERKCGYWEEFYTSSATEYRVRLMKNGAVEWTGYVTPDSFSESLQYRGSVMIIARDNLGLLQDFGCNIEGGQIEGIVSLREIIKEAQAVSSFAMSIYPISASQNLMPICKDYEQDQNYVLDSLFCSKALREMNMWEALESSLYSCGLVMRYIGGNSYLIQSIRSLGMANNALWMDAERKDVRFCAYGHRELTPAVKKVVDEVQFDITGELIDSYTPANYYGEKTSIEMEANRVGTQGGKQSLVPVHAVDAGPFQCYIDETFILNANSYPVNKSKKYGTGGDIYDPNVVYLAGNLSLTSADINSRKLLLGMSIPAGNYAIKFEMNKVVGLYDNGTSIGYAPALSTGFYLIVNFYGEDGNVKTLKCLDNSDGISGGWKDAELDGYYHVTKQEFPSTIESPVLSTSVAGAIEITIPARNAVQIVGSVADFSDILGCYLGVKNFTIEAVNNDRAPIMRNLKLSTLYKDTNNIVLNRSPKFAPNPSPLIKPLQVSNGMYGVSGNAIKGSDQWVFHESDTPVPLSALVHQQMLAYYAKPNNLLTGELVLEGDVPDFRSLWRWGGKDHVLMSGTLNVLTGRMESAVLREFMRYDHVWETWVENEDETIDYNKGLFSFKCHSEKTLTEENVTQVPSWLTFLRFSPKQDDGRFSAFFRAMKNASGQERSAIVKIDTAYVRVTQKAARDYGIDYGKDYS